MLSAPSVGVLGIVAVAGESDFSKVGDVMALPSSETDTLSAKKACCSCATQDND